MCGWPARRLLNPLYPPKKRRAPYRMQSRPLYEKRVSHPLQPEASGWRGYF